MSVALVSSGYPRLSYLRSARASAVVRSAVSPTGQWRRPRYPATAIDMVSAGSWLAHCDAGESGARGQGVGELGSSVRLPPQTAKAPTDAILLWVGLGWVGFSVGAITAGFSLLGQA